MPRYNAAPSQRLPVATKHDGHRQLELMRWGLVPAWAKVRAKPMINARSESAAEKPTFRAPFRRQRCLVVGTHFFEWVSTPAGKTPYLIRPTDQDVYAFAGLYDVHRDVAGDELRSFAILTVASNELMQDIHDRMPVILFQYPPAGRKL